MELRSFHVLRAGLALTFAWIGMMILQDPEAWGGMAQPWVVDLLPVPLRTAMVVTGALDLAAAFLLAVPAWVRTGASIGAVHLALVLVVTGVNAITVRDIGLLAGTIALAVFPRDTRRRNERT